MAARGRGVRLWLLLAFVAFSLGSARAGESPAAVVTTATTIADGKGTGAAATAPAPKSAIVRERSASGTLTIFNRPIVTFRSTVLGVAPDDRAESAQKRVGQSSRRRICLLTWARASDWDCRADAFAATWSLTDLTLC